MSKRLNRLSALLMAILLAAALLPTTALAVGEIETDQPVSLTISYKDDSQGISNARFALYKVADIDKYAEMTVTPDFEAYKGTVSGLADLEHLTQEQWMTLASTLRGYVLKDDLAPVAEGKTDSDGVLPFDGLEVGLYLVLGNRATMPDDYTYTPVPFMVFLPDRDTAEDVWRYHVTAAPKFTKDHNPPDDEDEYVSRKVLKKWDDAGYETLRPEEVIVQLLKDGKVYDTQTLNPDNNWRYAWDNLDADFEWEVIEKELKGYAVSITRSGITFTVTNKFVVPITGSNLPIQKRIIGDVPSTPSVFTFVFSTNDVSCPMPEGSNGTVKELTITGAGTALVGEITFEKPGTYVYTVIEKNDGVEGYTYDSTVYTVIYEVTEADGELSVKRKILDNVGFEMYAVEFTNPYKTPGNKLPKTGLLWWPVPVLLFSGCVFLLFGVFCRRRSIG